MNGAAFIAAKARRDALERDHRAAAFALKAVDGIGSGRLGLTPDSVKMTPEYRAARAAYDRAFAELRSFNATFVRTFKAELAAERRARVAEKESAR